MILDNLLKGKYTAPSGNSIVIDCESYERSVDHEVDIDSIPEDNKVIVEDLGLNEWKYTINALFFEPNCEKKANYFVKLLCEKGAGTLTHPVWKKIKVQPLSINQSLSVVSEIGQVSVSVDFVKVDPVVFSNSSGSTRGTIKQSLDDVSKIEAESYPKPSPSIVSTSRTALENFANTMRLISSKSKEIQSFIFDIEREIDTVLDNMLTAPIQAAMSIITLVRTPARVYDSVYTKLSGYTKYAELLFDFPKKTYSEKRTQNLFTTATAIGGIESVLTGSFINKEDALSSTLLLLNFRDIIFKLLQTSEGKIGSSIAEQKDVGIEYASDSEIKNMLDNLFTLASDLLLTTVYNLPSKRIVKLDRDRQYIELYFELNGIDAGLSGIEDFITDNNLQGDEFYILKAGREIVVYNN